MALDGAAERVHGTAIALRVGEHWRAALIRGPSGSGKSDLALRCIAAANGPLIPGAIALIADDQVNVDRRADRLGVSCPPATRGKLELRGVGIITLPSVDAAELGLIVDLVPHERVPRLPDPPPRGDLLGIGLPLLVICAFDASAPLKLLIALHDPEALGST